MTVLTIKKECPSIRTSVRSLTQSYPGDVCAGLESVWTRLGVWLTVRGCAPFQALCVTSLFHILNLLTECCKDSKYWSLGTGSDGPQIWSRASFQIKRQQWEKSTAFVLRTADKDIFYHLSHISVLCKMCGPCLVTSHLHFIQSASSNSPRFTDTWARFTTNSNLNSGCHGSLSLAVVMVLTNANVVNRFSTGGLIIRKI